MRTFIAYVLAIIIVFLVVGIVANIVEGIVPLMISIVVGVWLAHVVIRKITGKEPKKYSLFGFGKKEHAPSPPVQQ